MSKPQTETPEGVRALLTREHQELERLFRALLDALQADARQEALRLWTVFDDGLCRHMAIEEKDLLPLLRVQDPGEVEALLREHDEIRSKLAELGVGVDLHAIRVQTVSDFIEELRRHAKREDALAYHWAEKNLSAEPRAALRDAVAAARSARGSVADLGRRVRSSAPTSR